LILLVVVLLRLNDLKGASDRLAELVRRWSEQHAHERFASAENLRDLEPELKEARLVTLIHPLSEFREATFNREDTEEPLHVFPAGHFITPDSFRDGVLSEGDSVFDLGPGLLDAIPGLFTAIGILGTFIGLVLGLSETGSDGMPDAMRLVAGLKVSFKSSIYGLLASLVSTFRLRWLDSHVSRNVERFTSWLDGRMERGTEHALLVQLLREQRQATRALKVLKDDIREAFQGALEATLMPVVEQALDGRSETQLAGVSKIVDGVLEKLGGQLERAAGRFEEAAETTKEAGQWWTQVSGQLTVLTNEQSELAGQMNNTLQPLSEVAGHMAAAAEASRSATQHISTASERAENGLTTLTAQLQETLSLAADALSRMEEVRGTWAESADTLRLAGHELNEGFEAFAGQFPKAIETTMGEFDREMARVAGRLASVGSDLQDSFEEIRIALDGVLTTARKAGGR